MNRRVAIQLGVLLGACGATIAEASDWSAWQSFGNGVSISFNQVDKTMCTWRFRNDGASDITHMSFAYQYTDATTGIGQSATDLLPGTLRAGGVFGGWSAFSASTRNCATVRIAIKDLTRR